MDEQGSNSSSAFNAQTRIHHKTSHNMMISLDLDPAEP